MGASYRVCALFMLISFKSAMKNNILGTTVQSQLRRCTLWICLIVISTSLAEHLIIVLYAMKFLINTHEEQFLVKNRVNIARFNRKETWIPSELIQNSISDIVPWIVLKWLKNLQILHGSSEIHYHSKSLLHMKSTRTT